MSILDNDLYKFTMGQYILHKFPNIYVKYKFVFRNPEILYNKVDMNDLLHKMVHSIKQAIESMNDKHNVDKLSFIESKNNTKMFKEDYINFLKHIEFKYDHIINFKSDDKNISFEISGLWSNVVYYEVPILSSISSVISSYLMDYVDIDYRYAQLREVINKYNIKIADFGTRRRFDYTAHDHMIKTLGDDLIGTSNVELALKYNLTPIGTMAHELFQASQAFVHPLDSQVFTLSEWSDEYDGDLGIALSDTLGFEKFKDDFSLKFSKQFDGIRQDSGNPYKIGDEIIEHYIKLGINPKTKSYVCSDGLNDINSIVNLHNHFKDKINISFGIGTFLTNKCKTPPQVVIKMFQCNDRPVAKISDNQNKMMCNDEFYKQYLLHAI